MKQLEIERIERPVPNLVSDRYVSARKPVILTGIASQWAAVARWSPAFFKASYPAVTMKYRRRIARSRDSGPAPAVPWTAELREDVSTTLGEFVEEVVAGPSHVGRGYLINYPLFEQCPELTADLGSLEAHMGFGFLPAILRRRLQVAPRFWMGPEGVRTPLHFDRLHNLFAQIYGRKKFVLIAAEFSSSVGFPCAAHGTRNLHWSPIDPEQADLARQPSLARVRAMEFELSPGEILFIPAGWWHYVRSLTPSISTNFFWRLPVANFLACRHYYVARLMRRLHPPRKRS